MISLGHKVAEIILAERMSSRCALVVVVVVVVVAVVVDPIDI